MGKTKYYNHPLIDPALYQQQKQTRADKTLHLTFIKYNSFLPPLHQVPSCDINKQGVINTGNEAALPPFALGTHTVKCTN